MVPTRQSLKKQGTMQDLGSWGHEFVRALAGEVGAEYSASQLVDKFDEVEVKDLVALVDEIVPHVFRVKFCAYC